MLNSNTLSSGLLTSGFDGSLYTCMHHLVYPDMLVVGTGNGSLRFIDVAQGQKLHLWRGESVESGFPSLVSAICSCGSDKMPAQGAFASHLIAAGLSSGHCRLFDSRSGNTVAFWRAHGGYVTKLAAPEDHLLLSSSLDRTLRIWDLRRNFPPQPIVYKGHTDGISGFSVWGQDIISISRNKIGLSTLSRSSEEDGEQQIIPQKLYMADHGGKNLSVLSSICILPFSRLLVVGTEDGHLRICC
uniref:Neurobeachin n=3 Tax=Rhizophora mucronata TaxID=61149 RepID=A0A2P2K6K9_RHIMU